MSFEELLRKKLGPMRDLVQRTPRPEPPAYDPATLWYRRAVGLEVRVRPEETWSELQIGRVDRDPKLMERLEAKRGAAIIGLTRWTHASALAEQGLKPAELWRLVDRDLLFFSTEDPGVHLAGRTGVLAGGGPIARRVSMWPTPAVETAVQIAPMPFMPRGDDLRGAEMVGARFAGLERGFEVLGATITGSRKTGELLRRLLPLLDGRRTAEAIVAALPRDLQRDGENMLELLDRLTALEPAAVEHARYESDGRAQVTWLGHGAVLVQAAGKNVLVDPLFFSKSDPEERGVSPPKPDPRALPLLDAVLITHGDNDHLNAASLAQLPPDVPVFIPRSPNPSFPYQVDMRGVLRVLGFENVYEIDEWAGTALGDLVITACPFIGESWGLDLAQRTYLLEAPAASIFLGADSYRMDDVYRELAARPQRVDLAFMGVSGSAETYVMPDGFGYGNFYREWVPRVRHNEWVRHCAGPEDVVHNASLLKPRFVFGYAAGGASYIRTEYSDTGDHETMAEHLRAATAAGAIDTRPVSMPLGQPVRIAEL